MQLDVSMTPRLGALALLLIAALGAGCRSVWEPGLPVRLLDEAAQAQHEWPSAAPAQQGMDAERLAQLRLRLQQTPAIRSVLIVRHGQLVFEHYGAGFGPNDLQRINSITKSVISALVGIALDQGHLAGLDQRIGGLLPEARDDDAVDPRVASISVRDLLTMSSGFEWDEQASDACAGSKDAACARFRIRTSRLRHALQRPLQHEPGQAFRYDSHGSHLLSVLLARSTGMATAAFAEQQLFVPLGVPLYRWDTDGQGHALGGAGLYLRPRDVAKLGQLFLDAGRWQGRQLLSRAYVADATTPHNDGGWPHDVGYGYHWWTAPIQGMRAFAASGYGGQWIRVIPALGMVVVITADELSRTPTRWILADYAIPSATSR